MEEGLPLKQEVGVRVPAPPPAVPGESRSRIDERGLVAQGELRKKKAAWYKEHAEERRAKARAYYYANKEKDAAHRVVKDALKKGTLVKPESCSGCGAVTEHLEAHHSDYARPLKVKWLCRSCHRRLNSEL